MVVTGAFERLFERLIGCCVTRAGWRWPGPWKKARTAQIDRDGRWTIKRGRKRDTPPQPAESKKRYNQAPTEFAPVVRIKNGRRELVNAPMGLGQDEEWQRVDQRPQRMRGH